MKELRIDTVQQFNELHGFETFHPLINVARLENPESSIQE